MTYAYLNGNAQPNERIVMKKGQAIAGAAIGILVLDLWYSLLPGNVANASTYKYPVLYKVLKGTNLKQIFTADDILIDMIIEGGKELSQQGVRAIIGACGYFANYQRVAAESLDVPVFLSSLLQVPIILQALKPDQKVGIICASQESLTTRALNACGINDDSRLAITGAQDLPEFQNLLNCTGGFNSRQLEAELVDLAKAFVKEHPEIGAILLECSDMPPYVHAIQNAVRLPVFDFITLINWVYDSIVRRPFEGFI